MHLPVTARKEEFPNEMLAKYFDEQGRITRIEFVRTGRYCNIVYLPDGHGRSEVREVNWSDGHQFRTWKESDGFHFEHTGRPFLCEIPRCACCGECDRCTWRDARIFYPSY